MNKKLNNRYYMVQNVVNFLNTIEEQLKEDTHFVEILNALSNRFAMLQAMLAQLLLLRVPFAERRDAARNSFLLWTERLGSILIVLAKETQNGELLQNIEEMMVKIRVKKVSLALNAGRVILDEANLRIDVLKAKSRGDEVLTEAQKAHDAYSVFALKGSSRRAQAKELYQRFQKELKEAIDYIESAIYSYFLTWSDKHPELYTQLTLHMRVPEYGTRYEKKKDEEGNGVPTQENAGEDGTANASDNATDAEAEDDSSEMILPETSATDTAPTEGGEDSEGADVAEDEVINNP